MRKFAVAVSLLLYGASVLWAVEPKREFRGAWMNTIYRSEYSTLGTQKCKAYLKEQLDKLKHAGVNAVFFQVRPQADAFYPSDLEPWSRFLTNGGKAPEPYWDPLEFIINEAHVRGMELHAWLNPYRVTSATKQTLPKGHIFHKYPERFIRYEGKLYFDPALPENREFIVRVVNDIVDRYDVDGIHFDDYFYPYPGKTDFPDRTSYKKFGGKMKIDDWRRQNVDKLIEAVYTNIHSRKPWVRFGVSPFGIWRNKKSDSRGSATSGLENYDALYADVLLWAEKGWVDYLIPQLYWERGHRLADYDILVKWWNDNVDACQLYIGQDVNRTMDKADFDGSPDQLMSKLTACRNSGNIGGVCWWPAYSISSNYKSVADKLKSGMHSVCALPPVYHELCYEIPEPPRSVSISSGIIRWDTPDKSGKSNDAVRFVIYRSAPGEEIDISDPGAIVEVTSLCEYKVTESGNYVVTALNRVNAESEPSKIVKIK